MPRPQVFFLQPLQKPQPQPQDQLPPQSSETSETVDQDNASVTSNNTESVQEQSSMDNVDKKIDPVVTRPYVSGELSSQPIALDTAILTEDYLKKAVPLSNRPSVVLRAWSIDQNERGLPVKMTNLLKSRKTHTEKLFEVFLDSTGNPVKAFFTTKGIKTECTAKDIEFMWYNLRGNRALWNYYANHNMLDSMAVTRQYFPDSLFGKPSRLLLKNGLVFTGILLKVGNGSSRHVKLIIDNNEVFFYLPIVRMLQQIVPNYLIHN